MRPHPDVRQAFRLAAGTWILAALLAVVPRLVISDAPAPHTILAVIFVVVVAPATGLSVGLLSVARAARQRSAAARFILMAIAVVMATLILTALDALVNLAFAPQFGRSASMALFMRIFARSLSDFVWPFAMLGALYNVMEANNLARDRESALLAAQEAATRAEAAATAARLAALRYQLNPHVLFNTLNAISSLIVTRAYTQADDMLGRFSEFLRATLSADPEGAIPLEDELSTLQHYLEIESVRFEERLAVEFACPPDLLDALVPSFVLQPLVENTIKHAVSPSDQTVTVRIEAARDGDDLVVVVEDDGDAGRPADARLSTGVGLANVRQRLGVLYGTRGSLETVKRERGFIALVRLPLSRRTAALPRVA